MTTEKSPKSLVEQAKIEKSRAEEVFDAVQDLPKEKRGYFGNAKDADVLDALYSRAERDHELTVSRDHHEARIENIQRIGRLSPEWEPRKNDYSEILYSREEDSTIKRGFMEVSGFKYSRRYALTPNEALIQITDEYIEDCDVCLGRAEDLVNFGVFNDDHSERAFVRTDYKKIFIKLEPVPENETIEAFAERVLGWKVL